MKPFSPKPQTTSSTTPCGSSDRPVIRLCGVELHPDLSGALFVPDYNALLVADLHFEKGSSHAHRGVHLPPYDTRSTVAVLELLIDQYRPDRLVSLGDSFHDQTAGDRIDASDLTRIRALSERTDTVWLTGNHDPVLPAEIGGAVAQEIALGPLTLTHIPAAGAQGQIAGHLHPVATIVRRGRKVRRKCFAGNSGRLIMPALGAYTGGLSVWAEPFAELFADGKFTAWMLGRDRIHKVASENLRRR